MAMMTAGRDAAVVDNVTQMSCLPKNILSCKQPVGDIESQVLAGHFFYFLPVDFSGKKAITDDILQLITDKLPPIIPSQLKE